MDFAVERMGTPEKFDPPPAWVEVDRISICRATGFKARSGCSSVPLYVPSGKAPEAECPTHGGNYYAALDDPNAPRLFLVEQDPEPDDAPVVDRREVPTHENIIPEPYTPYRDHSPADVFEDRYRNLLREYGIQ
jgi:hypothetical protein